MKYIGADLLRKRVEKNKYVIEPMFAKGDDSYYEGEYDGYDRILRIIDSLQQEQSEALEATIFGYADGSFELVASWLDMPKNSTYKDGQKVHIIIVNEQEK